MVIILNETYDIAGYCRISVDEDMDRDNTSIENQKAIIQDFVSQKFPGSQLHFYEDRDRSGYTFEQREGYQQMRPLLMNRSYDILVIKDFSRFARRNSRGLVELEDLRDNGVRIISIGDSIDYPTYDDWTAISFRFLINEMPVTDASKKVKTVIHRRQNDGKWICAVPYGYVISNSKSMTFSIDEPAAEVIRMIFDLYNNGWGYKKISNHLTDLHIPTPRMVEKERKEAQGAECKLKTRPEWSIATVQGILSNDFYIGTLRQGKYTRIGINKPDRKKDESEHIVFEHHHEPIIDDRTFARAQEQLKLRTTSHYRGVKKNENVYSGFLFCGDCLSPMFAMSRKDLAPAYTCGSYHRRGTAGCSSHHIRVDTLDQLLKAYIEKIKRNSSEMLEQLNRTIKEESVEVKNNEETSAILERQLDNSYEELKATKRQRVRDLMKRPEKEEILTQTYDELEAELEDRISGLQNQIELTRNKRNTIIQVNRMAKTAIDIFNDILEKPSLNKLDIGLIVDKIIVYEDHLEIQLKSDIDMILSAELTESENAANFKLGIIDSLTTQFVQSSTKRKDKVYDVNVISKGDPLEIYTDKDGGVIFKKYSLMGGLGDFAAQLCETLHKTTGKIVLITDRDSCIAVAGNARKQLTDKRISNRLEQLMEARQMYQHQKDSSPIPVCEDSEEFFVETVAPILSEGDVLGCVIFSSTRDNLFSDEVEVKLAQTIAGFLGKHMES